MPRIYIVAPEGRAEADLLPHNTLGRHPNNTVQILDRIVSKEHCHIDFVDGRYLLRDLGSLNGSFVNGERITERVLNPGDEITIGGTRIVYDPEGAGRPRVPSGSVPVPPAPNTAPYGGGGPSAAGARGHPHPGARRSLPDDPR